MAAREGGAVIEQLGIAIFGLVAVFCSQDPNPRVRRFACIAGTCGQPFWWYATLHAAQWGMFVLTLAYTVMWLRGVWNFWIRRRPA